MTLWMKVTSDEYELPLVVEDSAYKLAAKLGVWPSCVFHSVKRPNGSYKKIEVEDDEGEDNT